MNQEQKFDKIIKKKVDEAEFPFDEQNWNKLSMQLDAERRLATSRGWGKFLFLGLLFLGITSASIALYKIQGPLGFKDKLAGNITSNDNNSSSANAHNANGNTDQNSNNNLLASNTINNSSVTENAKYGIDNTNGINSSATINSSANSNESNKVDNSNANSNSNIDSENKSVSDNNTNSIANTTENKNNSTAVTSQKSSKNNFVAKSGNSNTNESISGSDQSNNENEDANAMMSPDKTVSDLAGGIMLEHTVLDRIDARIPVLFSTRNVKTGALKIPNWYEEDYHKKGKKKLSFLNIEAGGAFLAGWDSKDGKDGRGLNWYAGVNYGKFINRKVGFSVGPQFYNISNIKQPFYESSKSVYGLGSTSSNTVITTQSLSYFAIPVKLYYAVKPAHQIGVGATPSFLFSSKNVVENYRLTDNIKSNETKSESSGIYEGVRLNNILVSAFYRAKINKRMFLNTEVLYGVRDIFKNTTSNSYSQKPIGVRVGVQFTLFEK
ncbi:MAG: hypothetical protein ABIP51_15615 [Bacteroidia bacterium]